MVAAFPWDDMLGFPTETVSMIKLLGALLLIGYFLRALSRDEDVRLPPTLPSLVDLHDARAAVADGSPATSRRA